MRSWVSDTVALLGNWSEEIKALEATEDDEREEVRALERCLQEEVLHCKLRRELEVGLCVREEEACELEARSEGLSKEASKLRTEPANDERRNISRAK